jgi:curved DNA-binding protein CbpA
MSQFGTLILVHVFSALLPPVDQEEKTYYHVLNLERNASEADIRKAYKKISLKLHPDKVAQRGGLDAEEAAKEYEKVQEAYSVLANKQKRETYDALRTPTRYRFYTQGALANPGALYENLTGASFIDKTKIVGFVTVLILLILLQPILICSKINQDLEKRGGLQDTSWFVVLIPYWIVGGVIIILTSLLVPFIPPRDRLSIALSALEQCFWYLAMIFLCLRWDGTWNNPYRQIFAPVYIAVLLRWTQSCKILRAT